jgi:hypothetical protein
LAPYKKHSASWKGTELTKVDESVLPIAESQIYADAMSVALTPTTLGDGVLVERITKDRTGRNISRFYGDPEACWGQFKQPSRYLTRIRNQFDVQR